MQVAVIGAGAWGKNVIRNLAELDALGAICDQSAQLRETFAAQYPHADVYSDWQQVIDSNIAAVAIATPTQQHFRIAQAALEAGKDVYVEKPLTHDSGKARELVELAARNDCILMVGHLLMYQPAIVWMRDFIAGGELGELFCIRHERLTLGRARDTENALWDIGVHDLAVLLYMVGQAPTRIQVTGHQMLKLTVEDEASMHLEFPGGVYGDLHVSWLWPETTRRTIVRGSKGMLVYDEVAQTVTLHRRWIDAELTNNDAGSEVVYQGDGQPLLLEMQHFLDRITDRQPPRSDGRSAIPVIETLEKASLLLAQARNSATTGT